MRYKVYLNELEDESNKLINYSKNEIGNKINELEEVLKDIKWYGKACSTYLDGYNIRINKLKRMNNNFTALANYLKECYDNYNETNRSLGSSWDSLIDEKVGGNRSM